MAWGRKRLALSQRGPLRVMFVITTMPVGGAETLLVELVRRLDRTRFAPEVCCLKYRDVLGDVLAREVPVHTGLISNKYDLRVLPRLAWLMHRRAIDAVVTVGTGGDKMFWGRLAAWIAGVPVICSALHSTGLPDHVERMNRLLTPLTDAFVGVAESHGRYLASNEGCPAARVRVIPNGVDTNRFVPQPPDAALRRQLDLPDGAPLAGIVAALRPEKNHELALRAMVLVRRQLPNAKLLVIGDGVRRPALEALATELELTDSVRFLGTRPDVPQVLSLVDQVVLCSHMEANPVSLLEAMAAGKPVVATRVGSVGEAVPDGSAGYLVTPGSAEELAARMIELWTDPQRRATMGAAARQHVVQNWSVDRMIDGYQRMIEDIYQSKAAAPTVRPAPTQ